MGGCHAAEYGWREMSGAEGSMIHVIPVNGLIEHEESAECQCGPSVDPESGVIIHDAMDRREMYEQRTTERGRG